jgi:hypothetical protein
MKKVKCVVPYFYVEGHLIRENNVILTPIYDTVEMHEHDVFRRQDRMIVPCFLLGFEPIAYKMRETVVKDGEELEVTTELTRGEYVYFSKDGDYLYSEVIPTVKTIMTLMKLRSKINGVLFGGTVIDETESLYTILTEKGYPYRYAKKFFKVIEEDVRNQEDN